MDSKTFLIGLSRKCNSTDMGSIEPWPQYKEEGTKYQLCYLCCKNGISRLGKNYLQKKIGNVDGQNFPQKKL